MPSKFPAGHAATKKLIASCAASGAGIEGLPGIPTFRFVPVERELDHGPPSSRGSVLCGKGKPAHIKNWNPARTSLDPMYETAMAGDHPDLTKARKAWANGDPKPLRQWLADEAAIRLSHQLWERKDVAA